MDLNVKVENFWNWYCKQKWVGTDEDGRWVGRYVSSVTSPILACFIFMEGVSQKHK